MWENSLGGDVCIEALLLVSFILDAAVAKDCDAKQLMEINQRISLAN